MSFYAFCSLLRSRWQGLADALWPDNFGERGQAELAVLDAELERRQRQLIKYNQKTQKVLNALRRYENRLQVLPGQDGDARRIEKVERLRQRLRHREQQYRELLTQFDRWKEERKAVRARLNAPLPAESVRGEEESDSGYPF